MKIETNRLHLRPITLEDKTSIFEYRKDKETNQYQGWVPETLSDVEAFIGKVATVFNQSESWFQLVIVKNETQQIIGDVGVHFLGVENKQVEVGCTLNRDFHGYGYATEALQTVIEYLFNELHKHRITTSIDPNNIASIKLVERLGFRKEAHFVKSLFIDGEWVDDIVYSILASEWDKN